MKKTFLFLAALAMSAMTWAETATFDGNVIKTKNVVNTKGESVSLTVEDVTCTVTRNSGNQPGFYTSSGLIRYYSTDVMTLSVPEGNVITEIAFNMNSGAVGEAAPEGLSGDDKTWTGSAQSVSFTGAGTVKINSIVVTYSAGTPVERTLQSIYIDGTATKLEYIEGESFDPAGLKVMGKYDSGEDTEITKGIEWLFDPEVFALGDKTVDVLASVEAFTSEVFTVNNIVVKQFVKTYANTYASENVVLTDEGGEYASLAKVIIDEVEFDAIKAGTSSKAGVCVLTIPAATKTLHFHAAGWKDKNVTLDVNGTEYTLVADAGVTNNSPFTLQNDPETQDYFTLDPKGATTITFTATANYRFVLFGVNAELQEGIVAAPTFTPTESEFDGSVEVTLSAEEGAEIFYALNEAVTAENAIKYTEPIELIETTTIYAVAKKDGKESEQASKTYNLIPVFGSLEALVTGLPATETNVTVIVTITEAQIDSFYVTSKGQTNGVYTHVGTTVVELYEYSVPEAWQVGGTLSATTLKAQWGLYKDTAELQKWENGWNAFSYTAPQPTSINNAKAAKKATKAIVNGQIVIVRDNKEYNVLGF